ncbi:MAG: class I SAM-dependent RNA methyltransferase [Flavobacteriia bacterium]|nr:class I SAM-dependent RNA methyltransferase [Flavobacteriia bacterium]
MKITVKTFYGLEEVLKEELEELGFSEIKLLNRAVQLEGEWKDVYFLNLHLRCALAILVELAHFQINDEKDILKKAKLIQWDSFFDVNKTIAVKGAIFSKLFNNTHYPFLLVKDAICDYFIEKTGNRPDVAVKNPQVLIDLYVNNRDVSISINTSGAPLYQRGYRIETGKAPINEVLAAGMIRLSKWDKKSTFIDPFCGSGTILIEAALLAADIPSQIERQHYAFKNFKSYDENLWESIYNQVKKRITSFPCRIIGSDINAEMIFACKRNMRALPISKWVELSNKSFDEYIQVNWENATLMSNPPYGERMQFNEDNHSILDLYQQIGSWFKHELSSVSCWLISSNFEALQQIGLKPSKKYTLFNGDLECSFRNYVIYQGSKKEKLSDVTFSQK